MAADQKDTSAQDNADVAGTDNESSKTAAPAAKAERLNPAELIREFEQAQQKTDLPEIYVGDTVRVGVRISVSSIGFSFVFS